MPDKKPETPKEFFIESIVLSLYFVLFSLITIGVGAGGALSAMYKGLFRVLRFKPRANPRGEQFKEDFLSTMPHSLLALIILAGLGYAAYTLLTLEGSSFVMLLLGVFMAFETWLLAAYIFPAFAVFRFPNTVHAFKTALLMGHFHAFTTLKLIGAFVIAFLGSFEVTLYLLPLSIVLYAFLSAKALHPTFMKYVERIEASQKKDADDDTAPPPEAPVDTEEDPFDKQ